MFAKGSLPARSAIEMQISINISAMYDIISNCGKIKEIARAMQPEAITKGINGTAIIFARSAVKGNLPKEKQRVIMVKTWADNVTAKRFDIKPMCRKDNISAMGFANNKIPNTAEKESMKLKENAEKGLKSKIKNAEKTSAVRLS